jgi:hypothetical protein
MSARLTRAQITQLAECLIAGRSRQETAELLGISVRTVSRLKAAPAVLAEMERLQSRTNDVRATDALVRLLDSGDERISLESAKELLRRYALLLK